MREDCRARGGRRNGPPEGLRGSAFGLLAAIQSLGNLAASGVAGLLWTAGSPQVAFSYMASWMLVALVTLARAAKLRGPDRGGHRA